MSPRFFADHCVSNLIIHSLETAGHQVLQLKDHLPVESPDSEVIAKARELGAILLSLNSDFADIVAYPPGQFQGVFALQVLNHPEITPHLGSRAQQAPAGRFPGLLPWVAGIKSHEMDSRFVGPFCFSRDVVLLDKCSLVTSLPAKMATGGYPGAQPQQTSKSELKEGAPSDARLGLY